jgi:hypothetical protein
MADSRLAHVDPLKPFGFLAGFPIAGFAVHYIKIALLQTRQYPNQHRR